MKQSARILDALSHGPATAITLAARLGLPKDSVTSYLARLMKTGVLTRDTTRPYVYSLRSP